MTDQSYRVVFEGAIAEGFSIGMVKKNLAKLFKADDDRIATIFSGQSVVLKKNIDEATALKYQAALLKAGATTLIRSSAPAAANTVSDTATAVESNEWSLAPAGSMLLRENERRHVDDVEIDLSHIALASSFLVAEPEADNSPPPPDTGHISIAEPGATLGNPDAAVQTQTIVEDLDATLAPVGAELVAPKAEPEAPTLDLSHLSVVENEPDTAG